MRYYEKYIDALSAGTELKVIPGSILEGVTPEGDTIDSVSDSISAVLIKEIGFYRNTVLPTIKDTFAQFEGRIKTAKAHAFGGGETIVVVGVPVSAEEDFSFTEEMEYMPHSDIHLNSKDGVTIREMLPDNKFLDNISNNKLAVVWDKYIARFGNDNSNIVKATSTSLLTVESVNDIFIIYYILKSMMSMDYVDGTASNLEDFRKNRDTYFNYIKRNIAKRIEMIKKSIRTGSIVCSVDAGRNTITIVEDLYKTYISSGGTPDALYGRIHSEGSARTIDDIVSNKAALTKTYKDRYSARMIKVNSNILQITNDGLLSMITVMVSVLPKDEVNDTYDVIKKYILDLSTAELATPIQIIEDIYADIIYKNSNLKEFLRLVRMYTERHSVKHAITLTISDMVATYLLTGVEVVKGD